MQREKRQGGRDRHDQRIAVLEGDAHKGPDDDGHVGTIAPGDAHRRGDDGYDATWTQKASPKNVGARNDPTGGPTAKSIPPDSPRP